VPGRYGKVIGGFWLTVQTQLVYDKTRTYTVPLTVLFGVNWPVFTIYINLFIYYL